MWASVKPRLRTPQGLVAVGGWDSGATVVGATEVLDPRTGRWQSFPGPKLPRSCATAAVRPHSRPARCPSAASSVGSLAPI